MIFLKSSFMTAVLIGAACVAANAQTATETLDWLQTKKDSVIFAYFSGTDDRAKSLYGDLEITETYIRAYRVYGDKESLKIRWSDIKDLKAGSSKTHIRIVGNFSVEGAPAYIEIVLDGTVEENRELAQKMIKALKNIAVLNGAKLVKDDLF